MNALIFGLSAASLLAGAAPGQRLPGSQLDLADAVAASQIIVVGQASKVGIPIMGGSAGATYGPIDVKHTHILKGKSSARRIRMENFLVRSFLDGTSEVPPSEGVDYLFFIERRGPKTLRCLKMMPATAVNMTSVRAVQQDETRMPGSELGVFEATGRAGIVGIGKLVEVGKPQPSPPGSPVLVAAKVELERTLKGGAAVVRAVKLKIATGPAHTVEEAPTAGRYYLFFLETRIGAESDCFKVIAATDKNIDDVFRATESPAPFDDPQ